MWYNRVWPLVCDHHVSNYRAPLVCTEPRRELLGNLEGFFLDAMNVFALSTFVSSASAHHMRDKSALNSFALKCLRTTFSATEGWGMTAALTPTSKPLARALSFQQLTNCPPNFAYPQLLYFQEVPNYLFCKSFVLITMRIAPGWVSPLTGVRLKFYFSSLSSFSASHLGRVPRKLYRRLPPYRTGWALMRRTNKCASAFGSLTGGFALRPTQA